MSVDKYIDTLNRLLKKGMSPNDETIRALQKLIEEESVAPSKRDDEFLNLKERPEIGRPTMRSDGKGAVDYSMPEFDRQEMDLLDHARMHEQYDANKPKDPYQGYSTYETHKSPQRTPHYGIRDERFAEDFESAELPQDFMPYSTRRSFQRPSSPPMTTEEELELLLKGLSE